MDRRSRPQAVITPVGSLRPSGGFPQLFFFTSCPSRPAVSSETLDHLDRGYGRNDEGSLMTRCFERL